MSKQMPEQPSESVIHAVAWLGERLSKAEVFANDSQLYWTFVEAIYREIYKALPPNTEVTGRR